MDRIEKQIVLHAPRARVWRAIADSGEFGTWFGVKLEGPFVSGEAVSGFMTHPGYEHLRCEMLVERVEPDRLFSFRWHPYAVDPDHDYSGEPMTLVEFTLEEVSGETRLIVVESGFEKIPESRRKEAFLRNEAGWRMQLENVLRYLEGKAA